MHIIQHIQSSHCMLRTTFNASSKSWHGPKNRPLYSSRVSLGLLALNSLSLNPEKVVQVCEDDGSDMSANELRRNIIRVALNLRSFGIGQGDVIGIVAKNTKHMASLVFGAFTIGAAISPLDPSLTSEEIAHGFNITRPKLIACDKDVVGRFRSNSELLYMREVIVIVLDDSNTDERCSIADLIRSHADEDCYW